MNLRVPIGPAGASGALARPHVAPDSAAKTAFATEKTSTPVLTAWASPTKRRRAIWAAGTGSAGARGAPAAPLVVTLLKQGRSYYDLVEKK